MDVPEMVKIPFQYRKIKIHFEMKAICHSGFSTSTLCNHSYFSKAGKSSALWIERKVKEVMFEGDQLGCSFQAATGGFMKYPR